MVLPGVEVGEGLADAGVGSGGIEDAGAVGEGDVAGRAAAGAAGLGREDEGVVAGEADARGLAGAALGAAREALARRVVGEEAGRAELVAGVQVLVEAARADADAGGREREAPDALRAHREARAGLAAGHAVVADAVLDEVAVAAVAHALAVVDQRVLEPGAAGRLLREAGLVEQREHGARALADTAEIDVGVRAGRAGGRSRAQLAAEAARGALPRHRVAEVAGAAAAHAALAVEADELRRAAVADLVGVRVAEPVQRAPARERRRDNVDKVPRAVRSKGAVSRRVEEKEEDELIAFGGVGGGEWG